MLITKDGCAYRSLASLYDWYDLTLPSYLKPCENCGGDKPCKITLDEIIQAHEKYKKELDIGHILGDGK